MLELGRQRILKSFYWLVIALKGTELGIFSGKKRERAEYSSRGAENGVVGKEREKKKGLMAIHGRGPIRCGERKRGLVGGGGKKKKKKKEITIH